MRINQKGVEVVEVADKVEIWALMDGKGDVPREVRGDLPKNEANRKANIVREWIKKYPFAVKYTKEIIKHLKPGEVQGKLDLFMVSSSCLHEQAFNSLIKVFKNELRVKEQKNKKAAIKEIIEMQNRRVTEVINFDTLVASNR